MAIVFDTDYPAESAPALTPLQQQKHDLAVEIAELRSEQRKVFAEFKRLGKLFDPYFAQRLRAEREGRFWDVPSARAAEEQAAQIALDERHRASGHAADLQKQIAELDDRLRQITLACIAEAGQKPRHLQVV